MNDLNTLQDKIEFLKQLSEKKATIQELFSRTQYQFDYRKEKPDMIFVQEKDEYISFDEAIKMINTPNAFVWLNELFPRNDENNRILELQGKIDNPHGIFTTLLYPS